MRSFKMTTVDVGSRCRICFEESNLHCDIFSKKGSDLKCIADIINDLCQLDVREDDGYPSHICAECSIKLCEFKCFKQKSRTTKSILLLLKGESNHSANTAAFPVEPPTREKNSQQTEDACESFYEGIILEVHTQGDPEPQTVTVTESNHQATKQKALPQKRRCANRGTAKRSRKAVHDRNLSSSVNDGGVIRKTLMVSEAETGDNEINASADESEGALMTEPLFIKEEPGHFQLDGDDRNNEDNEEDDSSSLTDSMAGRLNATTDADTTSTSIRNKPKLIHNGFMYTFDKLSTNHSRKYWRCDRKSNKCYGRVHTKLDGTFICEIRKHNHESDQSAINAARVRHSLSKMAQEMKGPVEEVVKKVLESFSDEEKKDLPSKDAMRRMIRRRRARSAGRAQETFHWDGN